MLHMKFGRIFLLALLAVCAGSDVSGTPRLQAGRGRAAVFAGGAGVALACAAGSAGGQVVAWLARDFTPLRPDPRRWRVLDNGTLLILPAPRPTDRALPSAVRCRATNKHGAVASPPITLIPVWSDEAVTVEAGAVHVGGVASLRCVLPHNLRSILLEGAGEVTVGWWRNDSPLLLTPPTPNSQYVTAGQRGEWLLYDGALPGDHYSCQVTGAQRSSPALLHVTDNVLSEMPRLALGETKINVLAGSDFCLPCAAPDHPPPHYTWYRENGGRLQAASEAGAWSWRGGAALCFSRAGAAAAGGWTCRASTARGDSTARVHVTVRPAIDVTLVPAVTVAAGGDTIRLQCQTRDPEATISWLHNGAPSVLSGDVTMLGGGVVLLRATPRTRGMWQCEALRGSEVEQATAELRLAEAVPELRYTFIEQALRPGARLALRCAAAGAPPPHFSWRRDNMPLEAISGSHRYSIGEERAGAGETVSTLNISAVAPEDGGRYTCRATNELGYVEHSARLNIYGPPLVRPTAPQRALAGQNVTLLCPYAGYPISSVKWQRGGAAVRGEGRVRGAGGEVKLGPALAGDAGRYTCTVTAPDGATATGDVQLLVLNPPKISPFMFSTELAEGNAVRVLCSVVSGDRPLSFSWLKDGSPLPSDLQIEATSLDDFSLLKFGELTERHSGDYTCRVTNPAASVDYTASLHVKVPPSWTREPMDIAVALGAPIKMECAARGQPAPFVTWHRQQPCEPPAACEWRAMPSNGTLWTPAAPRDLTGHYRCSADNGIGPTLFKHINISVYESAQIESANEVLNVTCVQAPSASCSLTCVARGDEPLTITWTRSNRRLDLHSGRMALSETRDQDGALRSDISIRAVSGADGGEYRCRASNTHGRSERLFLLHIEEPPPSPAELRVSGRGSRRVRVSWRAARSARYSALLEQVRPPNPKPPDYRDLIVDYSPSQHGCEDGWACTVLIGLQPGAAYSVRLRASSRAGESPLSAPLLFTTLEDAPSGAPQDVNVRAGDPGELHVSWAPPERNTWNGDLLGYAVTWRAMDAVSGGSDVTRGGRMVRRGGSSLVLRTLRARAQYSLTVRAFNRAGAGPHSPLVLAFTADGESEAPSEVRCSGVSAHELHVTWVPDNTHRQYEIIYVPTFLARVAVWSEEEEAAHGGWRARMWVVAGGAGEARVGGLRGGTNYSVWVRARAAPTGPSAPPAHCATTHAATDAVSVIKARGVSADSIRVWWLAPSGNNAVTHYMLYARDLMRSDGEWVQRVEAVTPDGSVEEEPARLVSGLSGRSKYELWVRAHSAAGAGPPSMRVVAAPQPHTLAEAAHIWSFPRVVIAVAGARVRLRCAADGSPPLRRRWVPLPSRHLITLAGHLDILGVQLKWAGNYTCVVRSGAGGADSVTHTLRTRPAPEPPPAPAPPRLARATTHHLHLVWYSLQPMFPPLIGYTVDWKREVTGSDKLLESQDSGQIAVVADMTSSVTIRGLACGVRYRVWLRAHNAIGASPASRELIANTAGYEPVPPSAGDFIWANSSTLRLILLSWDAPCPVTGWRLTLRPSTGDSLGPAIWAELRAPRVLDDVVEIGELRAGTWYEVRMTAQWKGGTVVATYRVATLTADGERVGESERLPAEAHAGEGESMTLLSAALLPAALALLLALLSITLALLVWRAVKQNRRCAPRRAAAQSLRPLDQLPPPPILTLDYTLPSKCDISDIRVVSARLSSAGSVAAGAGAGGCDSASDSSGEPCAACQRAAIAHTPARSRVSVTSLRVRTLKDSPPPPAPARPFFSST